jgi:hypothetical protein
MAGKNLPFPFDTGEAESYVPPAFQEGPERRARSRPKLGFPGEMQVASRPDDKWPEKFEVLRVT